MALMHDQVDDFVTLTMNRIKRRNWVDISLTKQNHIFASKVFGVKKTPEEGGAQLEWEMQVRNTGTARHSGLYDPDRKNVKNLAIKAYVPWSKQTANFSYDVDEPLFQSDHERIIEVIAMREHSMWNDFFELMEVAMWTSPLSSTQDPRPPCGIPHWLQKSATEGFNGGNPSGFSDGAAHVNATTYPGVRNWTFGFSNKDYDDLIQKVIKAGQFTNFQAPNPYPEVDRGDPDYGHYTTYPVWEAVTRVLKTHGDLTGVMKYGKNPDINGVPLRWVPALTNSDSEAYDATNPWYGVNWRKLQYKFQRNRNAIRSKPLQDPLIHNGRTVHLDNWGQFKCTNRREAGFVGYDLTV